MGSASPSDQIVTLVVATTWPCIASKETQKCVPVTGADPMFSDSLQSVIASVKRWLSGRSNSMRNSSNDQPIQEKQSTTSSLAQDHSLPQHLNSGATSSDASKTESAERYASPRSKQIFPIAVSKRVSDD